MKKSNAIPWWGWFAWLLAIVVGIILYTHLPVQVVGNKNRMTPRILVVLYEPSIMLVIVLLRHVLWRIDPKKRNYESSWSTYQYIGGVIVVCIGLIYLTVLGHSIMFMLIANVLPAKSMMILACVVPIILWLLITVVASYFYAKN